MSDRGERETDEGRTQYRHSAASPRKGWRVWPEPAEIHGLLQRWSRPFPFRASMSIHRIEKRRRAARA